MSSRTKLNIFLFVLVVALASFLVSTEMGDENEIRPPISNISANDIDHIRIEREGKEPIIFSNSKGHWQMTGPRQLDASPTRINAILQILQTPSFTQLNANEVKLAALLLETPDTTLELNDYLFAFGDMETLNEQRYLRFGDTVHLIEDRLYHQLRQDPLFFVNTRLIREGLDLSEIVFAERRIIKQGDAWSTATGVQASAEKNMEVVYAWKHAEANRLAPYSDTKAVDQVLLLTEQGKSIRFLILSRKPELILARADLSIQYHLNADTAKSLFPAQK